MTENYKLKDKLNIKFDLSQLKNINFGKLEGERDPLLKDCFFPTYTIEKFLNSPYNYVLSPKGAGKSALFRSIQKKFINEFEYDKYSIISVNDAFGFNDEYLNAKKFTEKSRMKLTISWGIYLLTKLIDDIKNNFSDEPHYTEFISEISKTEGFKEKFNLYGLNDLLRQIKASINFVANGQEFEITPAIKFSDRKKKISLNHLFSLIDNFYNKSNKTALILIDRIDNFVQKEKYSLQKKYIQGLFDSIEEISLFDNIHPTLFLRTDLFYSYDSDIEYDKLKDRTIELKWGKGETLNFLLYRLINNEYISKEFDIFLTYFMENDSGVKKEPVNKSGFWKRISKIFNRRKDVDKTLIDNQAYNYRISKKYLGIFFPRQIDLRNNDTLEFVEWIFEYLKDANDFINPRLLIYFFNQLMDFENLYLQQYCEGNCDYITPSFDENNAIYYKDIFHQNSFASTYEKIQNDALKNILTLIKKKNYRILFKEINSISYYRDFFRYGDINLNKFDISKETYDSLIKYLRLLGFCKETTKQKYYIPPIYQKKLEI